MKPLQDHAVQSTTEPSNFDRRLMSMAMRYAGFPPIKVRLWNDEIVYVPDQENVPVMHLKSQFALRQLLKERDIGFGDGYSNGIIDIEGSLEDFLCSVYVAKENATDSDRLVRILSKLLSRKARENSLEDSASNIHHHYDIGNDFYKLWLDEEMQYTCAYFPDSTFSIEQAQAAKMEHVCRKLQLKPGQTVVEAGCGWGSLAVYMARNYGVKVKSYNISHEQIAYAAARARAEGLTDCVEYVEDDYRNISGEYDAFVSVGMLEHVGKSHYQQLGDVVNRCLKSQGRALVHSIGRNKPDLMNEWIEKRIFPGAYPPTIREMMDIVEPHNFSVTDIENLRLHYAVTLKHWLNRFDQNESTITAMFDERFVRAWRLYLTGSIASFRTGSLQLFQMVFARGEDNSVPWTREHLYQS